MPQPALSGARQRTEARPTALCVDSRLATGSASSLGSPLHKAGDGRTHERHCLEKIRVPKSPSAESDQALSAIRLIRVFGGGGGQWLPAEAAAIAGNR